MATQQEQQPHTNQVERVIEDRIDLVRDENHHIFFKTSVQSRHCVYNVKFVIYVNEQTFTLLGSEEESELKHRITRTISDVANKRIHLLVPLKCFECNIKPACGSVCSGTILSDTLVPTLFEFINVPTCHDCEQDSKNSCFDAHGSDFDKCIKRCDNCGKCAQKMDCCARCRAVFYCDTKCQRKHWKKDHKRICKPYEKNTG